MRTSLQVVGILVAASWCVGLEAGSLKYCSSLDPAVDIPLDATGLLVELDSFDVIEDYVVDDTSVLVDVTHPFIGDLGLALVSPSGTGIFLFIEGSEDTADMSLTFTDSGVPFDSDSFTCGCDMMPSGPGTFADFDGEPTLGFWSLLGVDAYPPLDSGTLNDWCLFVDSCGDLPPTDLAPITDVTCAVDEELNVTVTFGTTGTYDEFVIMYNGDDLATLDAASDPSYVHKGPGTGIHTYQVRGESSASGCAVLSDECVATIGVDCVVLEKANEIGDDFPAVVSTIEIAGALALEDVQILVDITHTWIGDLVVDAAAPDGTTTTLHGPDLGGDADDLLVTFADSGVANGSVPYACDCLMMPGGPGTMADLMAGGSVGTWTLTVSDAVDFDEGLLNVWCLFLFGEPIDLGPTFLRGDADGTGILSALLDALFILQYGFIDGPTPPCLDAADSDGTGILSALLDALYILQYGFTDGPEPPPPFPDCDVGEEVIGCETSLDCP